MAMTSIWLPDQIRPGGRKLDPGRLDSMLRSTAASPAGYYLLEGDFAREAPKRLQEWIKFRQSAELQVSSKSVILARNQTPSDRRAHGLTTSGES